MRLFKEWLLYIWSSEVKFFCPKYYHKEFDIFEGMHYYDKDYEKLDTYIRVKTMYVSNSCNPLGKESCAFINLEDYKGEWQHFIMPTRNGCREKTSRNW